MKPSLHSSLYLKIILLVLFNLALIGGMLIGIVTLRYQFDPERFLIFTSDSQFEIVSRVIAEELRELPREGQDQILKRHAESWKVDFALFAPQGEQIAGRPVALPEEVRRRLLPPPFRPFRTPGAGPGIDHQHGGGAPPPGRIPGMGSRPRSLMFKTSGPTRYWAGLRIPINPEFSSGSPDEPLRAAFLIAVSDSFTGHGLFFDPWPLVILAAAILITSILIWIPFVRGLTGTIRQITRTTEEIANERFGSRVTTRRADELGRLGRAVNHLAARLDGFVNGQKRFLGDISHELNSPLARMGVALEILEDRADRSLQNYIKDAREEVVLMSQLVSELLAYARTGLKETTINLTAVTLRPLVEKVCTREAGGAVVEIEIDDQLQVVAHPELLSRALANVIRNSRRYAGDAGPIVVRGSRQGNRSVISITDQGSGIPASELDRIFEPFYRPENDRARETGGTGLGLAIVKTCVEACQGRVSARNLLPGFEIRIDLMAEPAAGRER